MLELNTKKNDLTLVDVIIDSEYFASICGFNYPMGDYTEYKRQGEIRLVAEVKESGSNKHIKYGLMVWHNKNYTPLIRFQETSSGIQVTIKNEELLPYPAIQRTKAWLEGLEYYLINKPKHQTNEEVETDAKRIFWEGIYTPENV